MTMHSWIRHAFTPAVTRTIRKAPPRARPALELLEARYVLSPIVVNNPTDTPVAGQTDLRQAIAQANMTGGAETIDFDPTVFATPKTITLTGTQLELTDTTGPETIMGPAAGVTVSGGGLSRVFQIDGGVTASISGLTITGGKSAGNGGGVFNAGSLTLANCTVRGNSSSGVFGGGVFNAGTATLTNCTVCGNSAAGNGGGLNNSNAYSFAGTAALTNCIVSGNSAKFGGGLSNQGTLHVASSIIVTNRASSAGGGLSTIGGSATIADSVINANQVGSSGIALGGGIDCENSTLSLTACTVNANQANGATALGGGIYALKSTVIVTNSTVNGNKANGTVLGEGGGIYSSNSLLTLLASIVKGNKATTSFDDIFNGP